MIASVIAIGFLATVSISTRHVSGPVEEQMPPPKDSIIPPPHEKRLLGTVGAINAVPNILGDLVPGGIMSSLIPQVTTDSNSPLPLLNGLNSQTQNGTPLVTKGQTATPLTIKPLPTSAQLDSLADKLGVLLNGIVPAVAPSIIAAVTEQALGVISSVEAIATDVVSLDRQVSNDQFQAPDALDQIGGLLGSLETKINDIVDHVTSNLSSDLSLPALENLGQVIRSGLRDIVGDANGPLSLASDLIKHNVCSVITAIDGSPTTVARICGDIPSAFAHAYSELGTGPLTSSDAKLAGDASASDMLPGSPTITGSSAITTMSMSLSSAPSDQGTSTSPAATDAGDSGSNAAGSSAITSSPEQQLTSDANSQTLSGQSSTGSSTQRTFSGISPTPMFPPPPVSTSMQGPTSGQSSAAMVSSSSQLGTSDISQTAGTSGRPGDSILFVLQHKANII